jgi:hypothetical protein
MVVLALGAGLSEAFVWPRLAIAFGPNVLLFLLAGLMLHVLLRSEAARFTAATGESMLFAVVRLQLAVAGLLWGMAMVVYILPGQVALSAAALSSLSGGAIPWQLLAATGVLLVGVLLTVGRASFGLITVLLALMAAGVTVGSAVVAARLASFDDLVEVLAGMIGRATWVSPPEELIGSRWLPILLGSLAFAGPLGLAPLWHTLYERDKGLGMSVLARRMKSRVDGVLESAPGRGQHFDCAQSAELERWVKWRRWSVLEAAVSLGASRFIVGLMFILLAVVTHRLAPESAEATGQGDGMAALVSMSAPYVQLLGEVGLLLFLLGLVGLGLREGFEQTDAFARGQAELTWQLLSPARSATLGRFYEVLLLFLLVGSLFRLAAPLDQDPVDLFELLALLSALLTGVAFVLVLAANNVLLPARLRPGRWINAALVLGAAVFLGGFAWSVVLLVAGAGE